MALSSTGIRPSLERKLQEFLDRSKEFYAFKNLEHEYLLAAFMAGRESTAKYSPSKINVAFEDWRKQFAKKEQEKYKRERSTIS